MHVCMLLPWTLLLSYICTDVGVELWADEDQDNSDLEHSLTDPVDDLDTQNAQYVLIQWFLQSFFICNQFTSLLIM